MTLKCPQKNLLCCAGSNQSLKANRLQNLLDKGEKPFPDLPAEHSVPCSVGLTCLNQGSGRSLPQERGTEATWPHLPSVQLRWSNHNFLQNLLGIPDFGPRSNFVEMCVPRHSISRRVAMITFKTSNTLSAIIHITRQESTFLAPLKMYILKEFLILLLCKNCL